MGTVQPRAATGNAGLPAAPPKLRQTVRHPRALAVGALRKAPTPTPSERANRLPVPTEHPGRREPGWRRRWPPRGLDRPAVLGPVARRVLEEAARPGQPVIGRLAPTALGTRCAGWRRVWPVGGRSWPVAGPVAAGAANRGFAGPPGRRAPGRAWFSPQAAGWLGGDRGYPAAAWRAGWPPHAWQDRWRLQGTLTVETGGGEATRGEVAEGVSERARPQVRRFTRGVATTLGILRDAGHQEPWLIALDCQPTQATVRDSGARGAIEPTVSDVKRRGCQWEDSPRPAPDRLERWSRLRTRAR